MPAADQNENAPHEALNTALTALDRAVEWVRAERCRELGDDLVTCPACTGLGVTHLGDTCACCLGARWVDEDRQAWWEDLFNVAR